jgi:hypothetical protein
MSLDHFMNSGFMGLEARPNSWFARSSELGGAGEGDIDHWIQATRRFVGLEPPCGIVYHELEG